MKIFKQNIQMGSSRNAAVKEAYELSVSPHLLIVNLRLNCTNLDFCLNLSQKND